VRGDDFGPWHATADERHGVAAPRSSSAADGVPEVCTLDGCFRSLGGNSGGRPWLWKPPRGHDLCGGGAARAQSGPMSLGRGRAGHALFIACVTSGENRADFGHGK
jgi:hypothetical protein